MFLLFPALAAHAQEFRRQIELADGWQTAFIANPATNTPPPVDDPAWRQVSIPHNWDDYGGATGVRHGNLHGSAWYRRSFTATLRSATEDHRVFLFFEGVGSYATVWVNGEEIGKHAGGLTTFTLDVTDAVRPGVANELLVRVDHPEGIRDLPWACGGCERVAGFSEGPQPFGIFRPVHVVVTADVRVAPFGVHVWNDADLDPKAARVHLRTEVTNHGAAPATVTLQSRISEIGASSRRPEARGQTAEVSRQSSPGSPLPAPRYLSEISTVVTLAAGETKVVAQEPPAIPDARLWSLRDPHRYVVESTLFTANGPALDQVTTPFGLRTIRWPDPQDPQSDGRFFLNGEPVFLNGTCDYEHNLGANFAFTDAQVNARVSQIEAAGFNAFRDAHHPHNLRFNERWDRDGLLWWTQFGAQIWFDREDFRANFRRLLRDWVKERRNSPSLVLWGLQNESKLPEWFAKECTAIIREMDPTSPSQRLVTTCNGGKGTDWDVPQNWTGTYGGDPATYAEDLKRQRLVGEYGAWRSAGLRDERGYQLEGPLGEERFATLLGLKVRLGESVRDFSCGHFQWIFTTHANPGRAVGENGEQLFDGSDELDHVGPANNKGLFTHWGEPTDAFYVYRTHASGKARPKSPAAAATVESDELTAPRAGFSYLYRVNCGGADYVDGHGNRWSADRVVERGNKPTADEHGFGISGSVPIREIRGLPTSASWGSISWAANYPHLDPRLGSQRSITTPIAGTRDDGLFQSFRYGREKLRYVFPVEPGNYEIELYFAEPWYGADEIDATGWRLFDVGINGATVLRDLDLFRDAGYATAVKKIVPVSVGPGGRIELSFPRVAAAQAVIAAIAITSRTAAFDAVVAPYVPATATTRRPPPPLQFVSGLGGTSGGGRLQIGHFAGPSEGDRVAKLSVSLADSDWIRPDGQTGSLEFTLRSPVEIFAAFGNPPPAGWLPATQRVSLADGRNFTLHKRRAAAGERVSIPPELGRQISLLLIQAARVPVVAPLARDPDGAPAWTISVGVGDRYGLNFQYRNATGAPVKATLAIVQADGTTLRADALEFPPSPAGDAWATLRARTGSSINAGTYRLRLSVPTDAALELGELEIE